MTFKSFSVTIIIAFIFCLIIINLIPTNRNLHSVSVKEEVVKFDHNYAASFNGLTDSLVHSVGKNKDYLAESHRDIMKIYFNYIDSNGYRAGSFFPNYKITEAQASFMREIKAGSVSYYKEEDAFYFKPFAFKEGDKTIGIVVYKSNKHLSSVTKNRSDSVYASGNRLYVIKDAW